MRASYRWHPQKPSSRCALSFSSLRASQHDRFPVGFTASERALWKLNWFLRDFGYDSDLLSRDQVDEKALLNLRGVIRTSPITFNGHSFQNLDSFAPAADWEELSCATAGERPKGGTPMIFSHTQISQYLRCPRSYRYPLSRWLAGKRNACRHGLRSIALRRLSVPTSSAKIPVLRSSRNGVPIGMRPLNTRKGIPGIAWSIRECICCRDSLKTIAFRFLSRSKDLQVKLIRSLPGDNEFVAYIDALGELDGMPCVIDWKTTTSRYPEEPEGLLSLDPQLICYSWISGIPDVAVVVFVRKQHA